MIWMGYKKRQNWLQYGQSIEDVRTEHKMGRVKENRTGYGIDSA